MSFDLRPAAAYEFLPNLVLFGCVFGVFLFDQVGRRGLQVLWHVPIIPHIYRMNLRRSAGKLAGACALFVSPLFPCPNMKSGLPRQDYSKNWPAGSAHYPGCIQRERVPEGPVAKSN